MYYVIEKKIKILAYTFYMLVAFMYGFTYTQFEITGVFHDIILSLLFIIAALVFITDAWIEKSLIKTFIIASISAFVYLSSHETIFVVMFLSAVMIKNTGYKKAFEIMFFVRMMMLFLILMALLMNITEFKTFVVAKGIYGSEIAYSLGYIHPNNLAQEIFYLISLFLCIKNEKLKEKDFLILLVVDIITYMITKSKTACILIFIVLFCIYIMQNILKRKKIIFTYEEKWIKKNSLEKAYKTVCMFLCCIVPMMGVFLPILFLKSSGKLQQIIWLLNGRLNNRLSNATMLLNSFQIPLFGKIIDLEFLKQKYGYNVVDNGYIYALFNFGIIGFTLIIVLYIISVKKLIEKNQMVYVTVITATLCLAFMENILRAMFMNFCMLFWWEVISSIVKKYGDIGEKR